jgi:S2P endopeptidase
MRLSDSSPEEILLWSGPRREVWEQVQVGTLRPRFGFLPLSLPMATYTFFEYLQMATLSLYLFNLLPLPFLDGTQLLETLLDWLIDPSAASLTEIDLEALEGGSFETETRNISRWHVRWKQAVSKLVRSGTTGLFGVCIGLALINTLIQH